MDAAGGGGGDGGAGFVGAEYGGSAGAAIRVLRDVGVSRRGGQGAHVGEAQLLYGPNRQCRDAASRVSRLPSGAGRLRRLHHDPSRRRRRDELRGQLGREASGHHQQREGGHGADVSPDRLLCGHHCYGRPRRRGLQWRTEHPDRAGAQGYRLLERGASGCAAAARDVQRRPRHRALLDLRHEPRGKCRHSRLPHPRRWPLQEHPRPPSLQQPNRSHRPRVPNPAPRRLRRERFRRGHPQHRLHALLLRQPILQGHPERARPVHGGQSLGDGPSHGAHRRHVRHQPGRLLRRFPDGLREAHVESVDREPRRRERKLPALIFMAPGDTHGFFGRLGGC